MFTKDLIENLSCGSLEEQLHKKIETIQKKDEEINSFITLCIEDAEKSSKIIQKKINDGAREAIWTYYIH